MIEGTLFVFLGGSALFVGTLKEDFENFTPLYIEESSATTQRSAQVKVYTRNKKYIGESVHFEDDFAVLKTGKNRSTYIPKTDIIRIEKEIETREHGIARGIFQTEAFWEPVYRLNLNKPCTIEAQARLEVPNFIFEKMFQEKSSSQKKIRLVLVAERSNINPPIKSMERAYMGKSQIPQVATALGGFSFFYENPEKFIKGFYTKSNRNGKTQLFLSLPRAVIKSELAYNGNNLNPHAFRKLIVENHSKTPLPAGRIVIAGEKNIYLKNLPEINPGDKKKLDLGKALDVNFKAVKKSEKVNKNRTIQQWEVEIDNRSTKKIKFEYFHQFFYPNWKIDLKNYEKVSSRKIKITLVIAPGEKKIINYRSWEWKEK